MPTYRKTQTIDIDPDLVTWAIGESDEHAKHPRCMYLEVDVEGSDAGDRVRWLEVRDGTGARVPNPALPTARQTMVAAVRTLIEAQKAAALASAGFTAAT